MAKPSKDRHDIDPEDGLRRDLVGAWCEEKHLRLRHYIDITHGVRRRFLRNRPSYIDLYCGTGKSRIRDGEQVMDGSALVAATEADKRHSFSEIHVADADAESVSACFERLKSRTQSDLFRYAGPATSTAKQVVSKLNPWGYHVAFLDPYGLDALPFTVVQELARINRMDLIMHISEMDMQRNVIGKQDLRMLEAFAPGAAAAIDLSQSAFNLKLQIIAHWKELLKQLGYKVSDNMERVRGVKNQPLYWLAFASRHPLGDDLWGEVSKVGPQRSLNF